jgi:hypothetical protein
MSSPRITYSPRLDATPEAELSALAAVYKILLDAKKKAAPSSGPDGMKGSRNDSRRKVSIQ